MVGSQRRLARFIATGGFTLLLAGQAYAQGLPPRMRGVPAQPPASGPFAPAAGSVPGSQPQTAATPAPVSMLQQPAQEARIVFTDNSLAIHAENSSLTAILHQFSTTSGMRITGLGNDERVFGTFGPGAPRDVLADLLNGTAYNLVLLGDLSNGAPRELILSPATHGGDAAAAAATAPTTEDSAPEPEADIPQPPPPPDVSPAPVTPQGQPGVRTPQQLFEQLQQMRQQQQQQQQQPVPQQQ